MTAIRSSYADILNDYKILYVPSCLVVEMMTRLYSQVSMVSLSGGVQNVVPDLLILLRRLTHSLKTTADAYESERIRFFIGDWKSDKLRARKLFFNLMSRLGYISELLGAVEKNLLFKSIEEMTVQWSALDRIMEDKCDLGKCRESCRLCRYFRSDSPENWQMVMAKIILDLDASAEYPDADTYLILLCYDRIGKTFARAIDTLQRRKTVARRFSPSRILCVSGEDVAVNCAKCGQTSNSLRRGRTDVIHRDYDTVRLEKTPSRRVSVKPAAPLRGRYPMPPSLAGMVR